jgi:DHA1 family tetracycline resistance protein-like MFS transporter
MSLISLSAPFYLAGCMAGFNAIMVFVRLPESLPHEFRSIAENRRSVADLFHHAKRSSLGAVMATYFVSIAGFALMTTLFALFTKYRFGYSAFQTGALLAFIGVVGATIQGGVIGWLVDRFGERNLASAGAAFLAVSLFFLPLVGTLPMLMLVSAIMAIGNGLMTPTLNALASRSADQSWQGRALGLMQSCGSLGRLCGPLLAGWLLSFDVPGKVTQYARTPFWVSAALMIVAFALTRLVRTRHQVRSSN